ncbi:MAG: DUF1772 domain-containing protein, partial [Pyrinomonadaceae bacterium]
APARAALSASSFVQYQQIVHMYYVRMVPALIIAGVLAALVWLLMVKSQWRCAEFWLVAASIGGILFIAVITQTVNAPLNNQLMTWSIAAPPANLREIWSPWERVHAIRAMVALGVLILEAVALVLKSSNKLG